MVIDVDYQEYAQSTYNTSNKNDNNQNNNRNNNRNNNQNNNNINNINEPRFANENPPPNEEIQPQVLHAHNENDEQQAHNEPAELPEVMHDNNNIYRRCRFTNLTL